MVKNILLTGIVVLMASLTPAAVAGAGTVEPYPAPVVPTLSAGVGQVEPGGFVTISGSGFLPGENVDITVDYDGPVGLRRSAALLVMSVPVSVGRAVADDTGSFTAQVRLDRVGVATIVARGLVSGFTLTTVVRVGDVAGSSPTDAADRGAVAAPHPVDAGGVDGASGDGLASTGVAVAGPLAVGAGLLAVGLALLFFGARLVIRRGGARSV